jgi:hypothetical protein
MHTNGEKIAFIESVFGKGILGPKGDFDVRCPFCKHLRQGKLKLSININNDINHCWVCGFKSRNLLFLLKKFGNKEQISTYKLKFLPKGAIVIETYDENEHPLEITLPENYQLVVQYTGSNKTKSSAKEFLVKRKLDIADIWMFKIGLSDEKRWKNRIIIPSFDTNGKLNCFVSRNIYDDDFRRKWDIPRVHKSEVIFNELNINWNKRLYVCENPLDMMKFGSNCTTILGSDLSETSLLFSKILENDTEVILALDKDTFFNKTLKYYSLLESYGVNVKVIDYSEFEDIKHITKLHAKNIKCISYSWKDTFSMKLHKICNGNLGLTI